MNARTAKACIATSNWLEGHRYLDFLFDCEEALMKLAKNGRSKIAGRSREGMHLVPVRDLLFEDPLAFELRPIEQTTLEERLKGEAYRSRNLAKGHTAKADLAEDMIWKIAYHKISPIVDVSAKKIGDAK